MYFDFAMPLMLFMVALVAMLLNGKVEGKLKDAVEEREFGVRNTIMLVVAMGVTISLVVFIPQLAIMFIFLFAYSMLLFIFTFIFSDFQKSKVRFFCVAFLVVSFLAGMVSLFSFGENSTVAYRAIAFFCLFGFTVISLMYEEHRASTGERWYLAALPPALFILLYVFFGNTPVWFPYLLDTYGIVFAVLIILYLGSLFTWRATLIFVGLLTVMDVILVLGTGTMVSAAMHVMKLNLPILVSIPAVPAFIEEGRVLYMSLGLGDLFFAGLIGIQTMKKFGKSFAILSLIAMAVSFSIFEVFMLNYGIPAFPGTLMIICGWLPLILLKALSRKVKETSSLTK
jgi:presenilin-like A22 family membrane protease